MVLAKVKFTLSGNPKTVLLTDRGWVCLHDPGGFSALFNHICFADDIVMRPPQFSAQIAHDLAEVLHGTYELSPEPIPPPGYTPDRSPR